MPTIGKNLFRYFSLQYVYTTVQPVIRLRTNKISAHKNQRFSICK